MTFLGKEHSDCSLLLILLIAAPPGYPPSHVGLGWDGNSYNHAKMEKRLLLQSCVWPSSGKHPTHTGVLLWSGCTCCSMQRLVLQVCWDVLSEQVSLLMLFMTCCMGLSPVLLGKVGVVVGIALTAGRSREVICWTDTFPSLPQTWRVWILILLQ